MDNDGYESEKPGSLLRSTKVAGALLLFCVGFAPMGFAAFFKRASWLNTAAIPFWVLLFISTGYALMTKNEKRASIVITIMWIVALLNLGGCADLLRGIGRATSG